MTSATIHTTQSWLYRLDGRIKLLGLLGTLCLVSSAPPDRIWALPAQATLLGGLMASARLPTRSLLRLLPASAAFGAAAALGWILGAPALPAASAAGRIVLSIFAFAAFTLTTPFPQIATALRWMRMPAYLITILWLAERYVHLLEEEAMRMLRASAARAARPFRWRAPRVYTQMSLVLVERALNRSEKVALALVSRGFSGEFPGPPLRPIQARQLAGVAVWLIVFALVTWKC
ncbi:MAG: energy-coupling factor transporter transmembrane component T family protein [Chthonomonadales bacterium]